ncbi:hypothetical protein RSOLAG22IIIB_11250 [Rhizoctonia solani]|uniref:Uncharacterized protein n=1 Tax=Rhizoctonia solani TaxID=456999 RepID=A0A0K6G7B1_9AGAM|nr:hypothetical protein RSOLAG22IIIB_11250 [Rhizoctonia solani]
MPSTRQHTPAKKRNFRNGALLAVSEAAKLVNVPLAQDVARHIRQVVVSLKPSVLQAPKTNDSNAGELAKHVEGLLGAMNTAIRYLEGSEVASTSVSGYTLVELHQLHKHLSGTYTKLQGIQTASYTTKLASQTETREDILLLEKELSRTIVELTLRLLVAVLSTGAHHQLIIVQRIESTARKHKALARDHVALVRKHNTLLRVTQRRQSTSDNMVRGLRADCKGLTRQVNAVLLMQRTDEQRIACLVLLNGVAFFF